jgi:HNH endonuclease
MAISGIDSKILWARAGGFCSAPECRIDLTFILEPENHHIGEMAHIIAKAEKGNRGVEGGGSNEYSNHILLCPTCHRKIDKSPDGHYSIELLHGWKREAENRIRTSCQKRKSNSWQLFNLYININEARKYFFEFENNPMSALIYGQNAHESVANILVNASHNIIALGGVSEEVVACVDKLVESYNDLTWPEMEAKCHYLLSKIEDEYSTGIDKKVISLSGCYSDLRVKNALGKDYSTEIENFHSVLNLLLDNEDSYISEELNKIRLNESHVSGNLSLEETLNDPNFGIITKLYDRLKFQLKSL